MSLKQDENCYSTVCVCGWVGGSGDGVGHAKEAVKVRVRKVACLLSFSCFSVLLWQCRLLLSSCSLISLKPALSSGPVVGSSLLTYQKTQEEKWSVS